MSMVFVDAMAEKSKAACIVVFVLVATNNYKKSLR